MRGRFLLLAHHVISRRASVCVSEKVRIEVEGKVDIQFENGGEQRLKNIAQPIKVFHWRPEGAPADAGLKAAPAKVGAKPSLALSPLHVPDGDARAVALAIGVNEAVASSLANLTGISQGKFEAQGP